MKRIVLASLFLLPLLAAGQNFDAVNRSAEADLREALERLSALRAEIRAEQVPLSRELNELEAELREKRREVQRAQRIRDTQAVDLNQLESDVNARRDEIDYLANLVNEFGTTFRSRINLAEVQRYGEVLDRFFLAGEDGTLTRPDRLEAQIEVVETAINRIKELFGGSSLEGRAIVPGGQVKPGSFALVGPLTYFSSADGGIAGLSLSVGSAEPTVASLGPQLDGQIRSFVAAGQGTLPFDSTLGNALAIKSQELTLWEHIRQGGIWIWPILTFAFLATATAVFKFFEIYMVKMPPAGSLHQILKLLSEGKDKEAAEYAKTVPGPAGLMLADAVAHADESKELIEEVMYERMLEVQPKLERLLPFIAVTAATAPLMGLLGTVTGMINTFKLITIFGTGDARNLSSGISEALVTTEFGLIVAIPALIMHALLSRRAQGVMANLERIAVAFVNGLTRRPDPRSPAAAAASTRED
ncbi:MAG: hypothetical protein EA425_16745 [Puniceicoccaceae bacterium]|nr:MAG: hypothetical protein EA425_16745 [Puniceicoccaceae bacterium]